MKDDQGCEVSDDVVLTVNSLPDCTIKGGPTDEIVYAGSTGLYLYNDTPGSYVYGWTVAHTGACTVLPEAGSGPSLTLNVSSDATGDFTVSLKVTNTVTGCWKECTRAF